MNTKHALALGALLLSSSAMAQQSPAPQPASDPGFQLGRPAFLSKDKLEALGAQYSGAPAPAPARSQKGAPEDQGSAAMVEAANAAYGVKGAENGIPLPPLPALPTGKTTEPAPAPERAPAPAGPSAQSLLPAQPEPVAEQKRRVFDGRPETTPVELQWGYETINRQEARWAEREAQYAQRYSQLGVKTQAEPAPSR